MTPFWQSPNGEVTIHCGDARDVLPQLPEGCCHMAVTSPPYFGLRQYADGRALGNEPTPKEYLAAQVDVFRAVRRVLRRDATLWVNMGDSYSVGKMRDHDSCAMGGKRNQNAPSTPRDESLVAASAMGMPWRLAFALGDDGWRLRCENIWHKPAPMPSSVNGTSWRRCRVKVSGGERGREAQRNGAAADRPQQDHDGRDFAPSAKWRDCPGCEKCAETGGYILRRGLGRSTVAHEQVFMLDRGEECGYFYDTEASREDVTGGTHSKGTKCRPPREVSKSASGHGYEDFTVGTRELVASRNMRSVWTIAPEPSNYEFCGACGVLYVGGERGSIRRVGDTSECPVCDCSDGWIAHFAAFPRALPMRCITAGTAPMCCAKCGAPHAPVVDVSGGSIGTSWHSHDADPERGNRTENSAARGGHGYMRNVKDYRATCACGVPETTPAVVLDPYGGTGQTALAALSLGRRCILVELAEDYCKLARARIERALKIVNASQTRPMSFGPLFALEGATA